MIPKQQGKAQAQRNIERMVAWLKAGGYEDERVGECGEEWPPAATGGRRINVTNLLGFDFTVCPQGKWDWNFMTVWAFVCWGTAGGLFIAEGFSIWPFFPIAAGFWALHLSENGVFERLWQRLKK